MLRRKLQKIELKLSDLEEYEAIRRRKKTNEAIEAGRASSVTITATETAPSTASDDTSSETEATQRRMKERANMPGWTQATVDSNTNSGSTEDSTSVQAQIDETDTIAELSDDGWVDIDEEDEDEHEEEEGAVGGEI